MAKTLWIEDNTGHYLKMSVNGVLDVAVDFYNRLGTNEEISTISHTVITGNCTIQNQYPFSDRLTHGETQTPHTAVAFIKPNTTGIHTIRVVANTNQGRTFAHNYQVIATA